MRTRRWLVRSPRVNNSGISFLSCFVVVQAMVQAWRTAGTLDSCKSDCFEVLKGGIRLFACRYPWISGAQRGEVTFGRQSPKPFASWFFAQRLLGLLQR